MKVFNKSIRILATLTFVAFAGSALASPFVEPGTTPAAQQQAQPKAQPKQVVVADPAPEISTPPEVTSRPTNANNRSVRTDQNRAVTRVQGIPVNAGTTSSKAPVEPTRMVPTFYTDYTYIDSDDTRSGAADGDTHSVSIGADVMTASDILLGFSYSYSDTDLVGRDYSTGADAHFFSLYGAKSLNSWLSAGVTVGYGSTSTDLNINRGFIGAGTTSATTDTWNASPFVSATWTNGPWFVSTIAGYQYTDYEVATQHAVTLEGNIGYAVNDKLSLVAVARYFQERDNSIDTGDDANWLTLGGGLSYAISESTQTFAGYEADLLNDSYDNWTLRGGLSITF